MQSQIWSASIVAWCSSYLGVKFHRGFFGILARETLGKWSKFWWAYVSRAVWNHYTWICLTCFSRMRSEGFPFIVGVWGWTCVRFVLLPRRRVVVANSLIRCHWAVHSHCDTILTFKVWKVEEVSHEMLVLASSSCRRRVVVASSSPTR